MDVTHSAVDDAGREPKVTQTFCGEQSVEREKPQICVHHFSAAGNLWVFPWVVLAMSRVSLGAEWRRWASSEPRLGDVNGGQKSRGFPLI